MKIENKRKKKQILKRKMALMIIASFALGVLCGKLVFAQKDLTEEITAAVTVIQEETKKAGWTEKEKEIQEVPWNLMLVNGTHFVEDGMV